MLAAHRLKPYARLVMGQPRFKMCTNLAVVLPNFVAIADTAVMARERAVNGVLIIRGLNFIDAKNMAGTINQQDAKRFHG